MNNVEVRAEIKKAGLYHYAVAEEMGISENTFCRMLRKEISAGEKKSIFEAISRLICKREGGVIAKTI